MSRGPFVSFNERGRLEGVNIAWKPSQQTGSGDVVVVAKNSLEDHPEKSCSPCRSLWLLPMRGHLPSCLWGHLLVQSSFGTNKAVPS